jgi:glycerol kinase
LSNTSSCLVLDQGGHASRALLFNQLGEKVCGAEVPVHTTRQGEYVEHDASELLQGLKTALHQASQNDEFQQAKPVVAGLATQRSNMLCWRRSDNTPLTPVISWQDRRAEDRLKGIDL